MRKLNLMLLAAGTGLFLVSCGDATDEKNTGAEHDAMTEEGSKSESVSTTYTIDPDASTVEWEGTMMGMYSHSGTLNIKSGSITVTDGEITKGEIEVDMNSITPTDDNYGEDNPKEKLVEHLSSAQFFDLENHPTSSIVFTSAKGNIGMVDLTVRGKTNSEEMSYLTFNEIDGTFNGKGELTFDRTKYDVSFVHPMEDKIISDDISISIQLKGTAN